MFKFALFAALVAVTLAIDIPFDTCGGGEPTPLNFGIPECTQLPCDFRVNQQVTLNIGVHVGGAVSRLPTRATIITAAGSVDYPLPNGDACYAIQGGCPTAAGDYLVTFPVVFAGLEADVETTIRVQIDDDAGNVVACGSVTTSFD